VFKDSRHKDINHEDKDTVPKTRIGPGLSVKNKDQDQDFISRTRIRTSSLDLTNKVHSCVAISVNVCCAKLYPQSKMMTTLNQSSMPKPDTGQKSRFCPKYGGPYQKIAIMFGMEKLEWCGCTTVKNSVYLF